MTESTRGVIGPAELDLMNPGGWLINVGRGALADEDALASALTATQRGAFHAGDIGALLGNQRTLSALLDGASEPALERQWEPDLMRFSLRRARYLLYPACDIASHAND